MEPKRIDIEIYQGATFHKGWDIRDSEGDPVDLSGWDVYCHIRRRINDADVLLDLSTENDKMFVSQTVEQTVYGFNLGPEDTQTLTQKDAVYDIKLVDPTGDTFRVQEGKVTIHKAVTRRWEL